MKTPPQRRLASISENRLRCRIPEATSPRGFIMMMARGIVIGDTSSGSVMESRGYSESQGSDSRIFYSFSVTDADLIMKDGKSLEHNGVVPDELVVPTPGDVAQGRDPALARAAEIAGVKLDPVRAGKMFPLEWLPL